MKIPELVGETEGLLLGMKEGISVGVIEGVFEGAQHVSLRQMLNILEKLIRLHDYYRILYRHMKTCDFCQEILFHSFSLKEKSQIATESFEYHENLANFIAGYLSDFLLNWYVRHGVRKYSKNLNRPQSPLISATFQDK